MALKRFDVLFGMNLKDLSQMSTAIFQLEYEPGRENPIAIRLTFNSSGAQNSDADYYKAETTYMEAILS